MLEERKYPDLIGDLSIIQGETYLQLTRGLIWIQGNWETGIPRGQIRDNLLEQNGVLLAEFEFEANAYDPDANKTIIKPYLAHEVTSSLPCTSCRPGGTPNGRNSYVYDIEISQGGRIAKLGFGYVHVVGEVTDNSIIWNPPIYWDGSIDHVSLTSTVGLVKTYTVWADEDETMSLGTFTVTDGAQGSPGVQGIQGIQGIQGLTGADGNGIASANYDVATGILTLNFTDSTSYQTGDLRGAKGDKGDKGDPGDGSDLSAAEIKTRYESNADTNAFTDAEQSKLSGIQAGAQVNPDLSGYALTANVTSALADKVDKVTGKQLSTEDYTTTEKNKLAGIASGAEVNVNADWNAVSGDAQILNKPTLFSGDYGDLTNKPTIPSAQVNSDWNAVSGISQILNKPTLFSGNYADLSGKPTLGTAAATDSTAYATAAQGALADTAVQPAAIANFENTTQLNTRDTNNRARANHTGTQSISTVDGLQTALDAKQATLVSGTNIKTINSESILGTGNLIITGGGDTSNLPNNVRINGVEHFYQSTKPTVRGDGSALVAGDRWWQTNTRQEWHWNGTYWLSPRATRMTQQAQQNISSTGWAIAGGSVLHGTPAKNVFVYNMGVYLFSILSISPGDWSVSFGRYAILFTPAIESAIIVPADAFIFSGATHYSANTVVNLAFLDYSFNRLDAYYTKINGAANDIIHLGLYYDYSIIAD